MVLLIHPAKIRKLNENDSRALRMAAKTMLDTDRYNSPRSGLPEGKYCGGLKTQSLCSEAHRNSNPPNHGSESEAQRDKHNKKFFKTKTTIVRQQRHPITSTKPETDISKRCFHKKPYLNILHNNISNYCTLALLKYTSCHSIQPVSPSPGCCLRSFF